MKTAIVGGGWAGLSAAVALARAGEKAVVFEASATLGGRARGVWSPKLGARIDNGQHILLGAYTETLDLMRQLAPDAPARLYRQPLALYSADGRFAMKAGSLPAPWHLLAAVLGARGLTLGQRLRMAGLCRRLARRHWDVPAGPTVAQWLHRNAQPPALVRRLWQPLCLAALNTPVDQACARTFARVLGDSLGGPAQASDMLIPRRNLADLWIADLPDAIDVRLSTPATRLSAREPRNTVNGQEFDAVILACPPIAAARLLRGLPQPAGARDYLARLHAFQYLPIATLTLKLARPWGLPHPMLMLDDEPQRLGFGQWLFDLGAVAEQPRGEGWATVVVSDARALAQAPRQGVVDGIIGQIREQTRHAAAMPEILGHELIVEKRAAFAATPALDRPGNDTPWPGIWAAGDWTDTGYPAVLEGAVRSGRAAALHVLGQADARD